MFPLLSHRYYEMEMTPEIEIEQKYILGKKREILIKTSMKCESEPFDLPQCHGV